MKSFKFLLAIALVGVLFTYSGCGSDKGPGQSDEDQVVTKLSKTWKCTAATLNGAAPGPTGYTYVNNFKLTIAGTAGQKTIGYTTTGRPANDGTKNTPWNSSGTFTLGTDFKTSVTREDNLPVGYTVSDTQLVLTFNYTGQGFVGGRVQQVTGNWSFTFTNQ